MLIKGLMQKGIFATINQAISEEELVHELAAQYGIEVEFKREADVEEELLKRGEDRPEDLEPRAPVVTFLGHVDHGKTSLLDKIRKTNVIASEAGGITQHIGASNIEFDGKRVVFLDTPGHRAFTAMRARGANVTDVVALVVAADDGVMPQTEEAINHAKAAGVPILVAVNKIDKPEANVLRVKQQLASLGLTPEEWGGEVIFVEVSALTGEGIDELLEMLTLQAEILELKANPNKPAVGVVLEARLSEGRGPVATVLIQEGTLHKEDSILCGHTYGRARSILDGRGNQLKSATPSMPVQITGLSDVPETGSRFYVMKGLQEAKEIAEERQRKMWASSLAAGRKHLTLDSLYENIRQGKVKKLNMILKADTKGSLEVLTKSLQEISTEEVMVDILHKGVGGINESDVDLADASDAIIIGFHVVPEEKARQLAKDKGVEVNLYQVIYQVTDDIRAALEHRLEPEKREVVLGHMTVRKVFKISRVGTIAGCYVTDGRIPRTAMVRIIRNNVVIYTGRIESLKRFKDDVAEAKEGFECGAKIENYDDVKVDDEIEAFTIEEVARKLQ
jgi:translation initiation factor IF-2